jgi:hypothetical protein
MMAGFWSVPTKWEARYLRFLAGPRPNSINRIPSPETLARMADAGWLVRVNPNSKFSPPSYDITPAGREALQKGGDNAA